MTVRSHKGPAPQRKVVEEKITSAQRDRHDLKLKIRELEGRTMVGWRELCAEVPEIEELRSNLVELVFRAQAFPGVQLAYADEIEEDEEKQKPGKILPVRRTGHADPISGDGLSTTHGRATLADRKHLDWIRKQITNVAENVLRSMEAPASKRAEKPRCWTRGCIVYSQRFPFGATKCSECQQPFSKSGPEPLVASNH
jgi:hypothetical protein